MLARLSSSLVKYLLRLCYRKPLTVCRCARQSPWFEVAYDRSCGGTQRIGTQRIYTQRIYTQRIYTQRIYKQRIYTQRIYTQRICTQRIYKQRIC
jgi:hypothetical protein